MIYIYCERVVNFLFYYPLLLLSHAFSSRTFIPPILISTPFFNSNIGPWCVGPNYIKNKNKWTFQLGVHTLKIFAWFVFITFFSWELPRPYPFQINNMERPQIHNYPPLLYQTWIFSKYYGGQNTIVFPQNMSRSFGTPRRVLTKIIIQNAESYALYGVNLVSSILSLYNRPTFPLIIPIIRWLCSIPE